MDTLAQRLLLAFQDHSPALFNLLTAAEEGEEYSPPPAWAQRRSLESTTDDAFWTPSSNNSYVPSANVKNGHMLSNQKLALNATYLQAVITLPIVFLVLGLVSGLFTALGLICRCCCKCCKCLPKEKGETEEERVHAVKTQKQGWTALFFVLVLFALIADFLCYYGYDYIDQGVNKFYDAMTLLADIVSNISEASTAMNTDAASMSSSMDAAQTSCCIGTSQYSDCLNGPFKTLATQIPLFESATKSISSAVSPFNKILAQFIDLTKQYLFDDRKIFIFVIFAIALVDIILLVISQVRAKVELRNHWTFL